MVKLTLVFAGLISIYNIKAQDPASGIRTAFQSFEKNPELRNAAVSLCVADISSGKIVFEKNSQTGLAPASCLKVLTAVTVLEMFGKDYRFQTRFGYTGTISGEMLDGNIIITGSGDPSLGSERFKETSPSQICAEVEKRLKNKGIKGVRGGWQTDPFQNTEVHIPGGWPWEDIGNYYGAGFSLLNWHENSYRIYLRPGKKERDPVVITNKIPGSDFPVRNEIVSGKKGSGDNAYIFFKPVSDSIIYRGTIPCCVDSFDIDAAMPDPANQIISFLSSCTGNGSQQKQIFPFTAVTNFYTYQSPTIGVLTKPFLQKSINLYGESFLYLIGTKPTSTFGSGESIDILKEFWQKNGIEKTAIQIFDGSGLSPSNRITTDALVKVLLYAKKRSWFPDFFDGLPVINGIKMKSGAIEGVRSYTGYLKSENGKEYCFSLIVNNFSGSSSELTSKIFSLLSKVKLEVNVLR